MIDRLRGFLIGTMFLTIAAACPVLGNNPGEFTTYAEFGFIRHITASMEHVYFVTTEGIIRYNRIDERWDDPMTGSDGIDHREISRLWVDTFGEKLVALTADGYQQYDFLFDRWYYLPDRPQVANEEMHVSPLPVMYPPGPYNYVSDGRLIDPYGREFQYTDVLDDNSGTLWIGTWGNGAIEAPRATGLIELLPYGLLQNQAGALCLSDGFLMVGGATLDSPRTGLSIFDTWENQFFYIESGLGRDFPAVDINCVTTDDSLIYVGTPDGLYLFDRESLFKKRTITERTGLIDKNVLCCLPLGDTLIVGTEEGLTIFYGPSDSIRFSHLGALDGEIVYGLELADSAVWIASEEGALRMDLADGKVQKFQDPDLVLFGAVYDIELVNNLLWFSADAGLVALDLLKGTTTPFREAGLAGRFRAIAANERVAAIATSRGFWLVYFRRVPAITREFTTDDGLPSSSVLSLIFDGDYLWIGSDRGVTRFLWNNPNRVD